MLPLATRIDALARMRPDAPAFLGDAGALDWRGYAERSERFAARLAALGLAPGERVAVMLPDGPGVHVAYVGCEKAGLIVMGIGPRAGREEIRHLLAKSGAVALVSRAAQRELDLRALFAELRDGGLPLREHIVVEAQLEASGADTLGAAALGSRRLGVEDLFLLNSTSGTTGLPKCVTHHQARWFHFHELAIESGELTPSDVFMSVLPAPFGFGLWTAHFTPAALGAPCVLLEKFMPEAALAAIERHRVTVLAAVSTQFIMLLNSPALDRTDLASLRVLYTGGEAVPYERALEWEQRTGSLVLQFYGSNETGALSRTTTRDSQEKRLTSAGRLIDSMRVRLFDAAGDDVSASGQGIPACRGPLACRGYYDDVAANQKLYTRDGWLLTGDIGRIDADGYLAIVGRTADFIIRGGKNISGPAVEDAVASHPAVALAAAVAWPDAVYGERVCVYAELRAGAALTLEQLTQHLAARGTTREWWPERLVVVDALPRASGGKVAKGELRADARRRAAEAH
ncbi:MAG TPA: class I adenylate-forming enzyme family protein [Myxococcota bacterium]|jgi:acyl-CoA synthetase